MVLSEKSNRVGSEMMFVDEEEPLSLVDVTHSSVSAAVSSRIFTIYSSIQNTTISHHIKFSQVYILPQRSERLYRESLCAYSNSP